MAGIGGQIGDSRSYDIAVHGLLDLGDAVVYVFGLALGEHFDRPVRQITHKTC